MVILRLLFLMVALVSVMNPALGAPASCDEACLGKTVDTYLAALLAHDASKLPTTPDVRFTENTIALPMNEALWTTISKVRGYKHVIPDVEAGAVGFYVTIEENGKGALLSGRMKIVAGRVSELETLVARQADMGAILKTDATEVREGFRTLVPPDKRASRESLMNAAKAYFDGLEQSTASIVPFADDCMRFENGTQTAGKGLPPRILKTRDGRDWSMPRDCRGAFDSRMYSYIRRIDHRRYPVIDRSHGVAMGVVTFQHSGSGADVDVPGVGKVPALASTDRPFAVGIMEIFEVKDGSIHEIEAVMITLPYGAGTGW
jgi:hypothetical protein